MDPEAGVSQRRHEQVAPLAVAGDEIGVVRIREAKRGHRRGLQRRRRADRQEVVDAPDADDSSGEVIVQPIRQPVTE